MMSFWKMYFLGVVEEVKDLSEAGNKLYNLYADDNAVSARPIKENETLHS